MGVKPRVDLLVSFLEEAERVAEGQLQRKTVAEVVRQFVELTEAASNERLIKILKRKIMTLDGATQQKTFLLGESFGYKQVLKLLEDLQN